MKEQKHDRQTGPAADEAAKTLALFAGKLDEATQCAPDAAAQVEEKHPQSAVSGADRAEAAATTAAGRMRGKTGKAAGK